MIMVLNGMPSERDRVEESERLINWAFAQFENVKLFSAGDPVETAKVWLGTEPSVPLVSDKDLVITMPRNWQQRAKVMVDYDAPLPAPVRKGSVVGKLTVSGDGVPSTELPLVAGADVRRLSLPGRAVAALSHYVTGS